MISLSASLGSATADSFADPVAASSFWFSEPQPDNQTKLRSKGSVANNDLLCMFSSNSRKRHKGVEKSGCKTELNKVEQQSWRSHRHNEKPRPTALSNKRLDRDRDGASEPNAVGAKERAGPKTSRSENVVIAIPTPRRQDAAKQFEPMVSIKLDKAQETSRSFPEMKAMGRVYQPSRLPHPAWLQPS